MGRNETLRKIVFAALFAVIIFIGISAFRIPIPAMTGRPFIHFGNALVVLAILYLGWGYGTLAGVIGLGMFDVLNGFASTAIFTVAEVVIVSAVIEGVFMLLQKDDTKMRNIVLVALSAGGIKLVTSYLENVIILMIAGTNFNLASAQSIVSLPATLINSISTVFIVSLLYFPIKKLLDRSGILK